MKKEEIIRRCYGGMKERHGVETIILFHVGDSFEAYFDDAETIIPFQIWIRVDIRTVSGG